MYSMASCTKYVPDVVFRQCFKFVAESRQNPDKRMSNDHKLKIVNSMLSFHLGWHYQHYNLILVPKMTLMMFSCAPCASAHIMMVSKLTLIIPTMCIRSLGLEGNFCFNKSWAVKSITALAICREIVTHTFWFFIKTSSSSLGLGERLEEGEKESTMQLCPLFPP